MKALRSFTVQPKLPEELAPLYELAMNLRWSWDERTRDLFRWVEPDHWEESRHDPMALLSNVKPERLEALSKDSTFLAFLDAVQDDLRRELESPKWFQGREHSPLRAVAYFSPEFGIAEAVPQYSGGLGVLAGDHLKTASDLGVPLSGIGLLYRQGYFRQELNIDGWQEERYPTLDPHAMALTLMEDKRVAVDLAGTRLTAQIWRAQVGRVPLYFLDADIEDNDEEGRLVTDRLYGGGTEHRIRQEILLGVGGVRALDELGKETQIFHTNEGHAGFLGLERIRRFITELGLTFEEAIEATRSGTIFTTHTPVPAGIDRFPRELMERYFKAFADECDIDFEKVMALGHFDEEPEDAPFNMAVMGLRLAGMANGVSRLHGEVSRSMFSALWPQVPEDEVPITSVTNGVHARTWISPEMNDVLNHAVIPSWDDADEERWARVRDARDDEIWRAKEQARERLIAMVRTRMRRARIARGASESDVSWVEDAFDPRALTVGFARRFATYKRATLLLSQPERLKMLLLSSERPVQFIFAGKAHPADDKGKEMIREIVQFSSDPQLRHRIAFVEDYDIALARAMYQGADVWLNNPIRPMEACGTSGEKAALNGALNCSILDGWWAEMFDGENGWAISSAENHEEDRRNELEVNSLFEILERQIVPLYYDRRREGPVPRAWVGRIKSALKSLGPRVVASRMVRDYVEQMYEPVAASAERYQREGYSGAKEIAAWKQRVGNAWPEVAIQSIDGEDGGTELGGTRMVRANIALGPLTQDDVDVQLLHGPVGPSDELTDTTMVTMTPSGSDEGVHQYQGTFECHHAGRYGFTVRVIPAHPTLLQPIELGRITWA